MSRQDETITDLLDFIQASPTPYHCVSETRRRLEAEGFAALNLADGWVLEEGHGYFVASGGALVAFRLGQRAMPEAGVRVVGAHTDSPNLRVKPLPEIRKEGYGQLGVEVYGGPLTYTWLDRDLGMAGIVIARDDDGSLTEHLVRIDKPLLRIPSLAIHLNRELKEKGLKVNPQDHLAPLLCLLPNDSKDDEKSDILKPLLADTLDLEAGRILSWDLALMDLMPPTRGGLNEEFIFAPRIDNQAMCHASTRALLAATPADATAMACLYDHEEVGSRSPEGAAGGLVGTILHRLAEVDGPGACAGGLGRAMARSTQISADMAHAVHPGFVGRHEPQHLPKLNAGPVIKINAMLRYATSARSAAMFEVLCQDAEVPYQKFVNRTDVPCGSTIGPISAALLGISTVDVGNPMLSMHSIREQAGAEDHGHMIEVMRRFYSM